MTHCSENTKRLNVQEILITDNRDLFIHTNGFNDVCIVVLPANSTTRQESLTSIRQGLAQAAAALGAEATLVTIGDATDLVLTQESQSPSLTYQSWIAIKRTNVIANCSTRIPNHHFGALIHTRYKGTLRHTKTRIAYTYCPACDKTTKDYGGKKHTYH